MRPDGLVLFGEPFWQVTDAPPAEYLAADELTARTSSWIFPGCTRPVLAAGFRLRYQVVSNGQDWDRYEMLQSLSVDRWAAANPDHPDRDDVLALPSPRRSGRSSRWGREAHSGSRR